MDLEHFFKEHRNTLSRFLLVGGLSTILNYTLFTLLFYAGWNYLVSSACGYIFGLIFGFIINKKFTFRSSEYYPLEILKYFLIYASSLFLMLIFLKGLVYLGVPILLANLFSIGLASITNYLGSKYFVFSSDRKRIDYLLYRYRYLANYVLIGVSSLFLEVLLIYFLSFVLENIWWNTLIGFFAGVFFSFLLNSKLNFKVPPERNLPTLRMFVLISILAYCLNLVLIHFFFGGLLLLNYSISRFLSAALIFLLSYSLHRRFTFLDVKEVGVAVYLSSTEDVLAIYQKVTYHPDWIHFDLVDETFKPTAREVDVSKGLEAQKYWPSHLTMTHLMSKNPSSWLQQVLPFSDYVLVHVHINDPLEDVFSQIHKAGKRNGLVLSSESEMAKCEKFLDKVDMVQILGIPKPGESGQHLQPEALALLQQVNDLRKKNNYHYQVCFDGGIKTSNVERVPARYLVSGSAVLRSADAAESIYALKTNSRYYYRQKEDLKKFLKTEIIQILDNIPFVVSGTIVGSFVEKEGLEGISDIDTIVILDSLSPGKFSEVVRAFKKLETILQTDFGYNFLINTTFGPLKFNKPKTVVLHLMIYDVVGHREHCEKSPFTCLDWQRSACYVKKKMAKIWAVTALQPNDFFSARRSVRDYLQDLSSGKISYREYAVKSGKLVEQVKAQKMSSKDSYEFSYHIIKFCMLNFLKLITGKNAAYPLEELCPIYFNIFPKSKDKYLAYLKKISIYKTKNNYPQWKEAKYQIIFSFLQDFEQQLKHYFFEESTKIYFFRHLPTKENLPGVFLGQGSDPDIVPTTKSDWKKPFQESFFKEKKIIKIYSSPARRCLETAQILLTLPYIDSQQIIVDQRLKEINYGAAEGKDYNYLQKAYPALIHDWERHRDAPFPEGENNNAVSERVNNFIKELIPSEKLENSQELDLQKLGSIFVITHNVPLRCLIGQYFRIPIYQWHLLQIPFFEPLEAFLTRDGKLYFNLTPEQKKNIFEKVALGEE